MADSIRKVILNKVLERLRSISPTNGYRSEVPNSHIHLGDARINEYPALLLIIGAERVEPTSHDLQTWALPLEIECWNDKEHGEPWEGIEDLLADVRQAIQLDETFGDQTLEVNDLGASAPAISEADPERAAISLNLEIKFRHQRLNPSLP